MSDLLLLGPIPLPNGLDIPAEDWHPPPTSVRHQALSLLKRVDVFEARCKQDSSTPVDHLRQIPPRKNANDGRALLSDASPAPRWDMLAIPRGC